MRFLVVIILLASFSVGSIADMAHAAALDHVCVHHQMNQDDSANKEPCHSEQDQSHDENGCDDCCCAHSHSMATSNAPVKTPLTVNRQYIAALADHHYSAELSGLRRPPRL